MDEKMIIIDYIQNLAEVLLSASKKKILSDERKKIYMFLYILLP